MGTIHIKMSLKERKEPALVIEARESLKREKERQNYYKNGDLYDMEKIEKALKRKRGL